MIKEGKVEGKVEANKKKKESELYSAAYELFISKGVHNTAIDDIVKRAGVAKGTFYLYFKDKYDVLNNLILQKSIALIRDGVNKTEEKGFESFEERTVYFINYVIDYFKENKLVLKLINKNFSWGLFRRALVRPEINNEVEKVVSFFIENSLERNMNLDEAELTLFMIFELVGSVCYSSIILEEPRNIEEVKPILFKNVLAMMK